MPSLSPQTETPTSPHDVAERLNRECLCVSLDQAQLRRQLDLVWKQAGLYESISQTRPHLFAPTTVYTTAAQVAHMREIVQAVETVVAAGPYREHVLARAPAVAHRAPGAHGVFLGFDFHLDSEGPKLIEINSNAGGAMLNVVLRSAQQACCHEAQRLAIDATPTDTIEQTFLDMFAAEWQTSRGETPLNTVVIVDTHPREQYLYPEFLLFARLFERRGWKAVIADPAELKRRAGRIWHGDTAVDLIYNRLTDFYLEAPEHEHVRDAYLEDRVVLTPHPHQYALYADKRNLAALTDATRLRAWGIAESAVETLKAGIPPVRVVDRREADALWEQRRRLFFKPAVGYGSRAAYRGDKLTRRVFAEILKGNYVAQEIAPPSERQVRVAGQPVALKLDMRCFVYRGAVQLISARLYQGQTTNFRTPGGGFAPVFTVRDPDHLPAASATAAMA
jgi:hypothetical protein